MATATEVPTRTKITSTVVKETLPSNGSAEGATVQQRYKGDFWQIIWDGISREEWMANGGGHQVRVYRADDRWENSSSPVGNKMIEPFMEETIREKWGGGRYNLWLYGPPNGVKLVGDPFRLELEGIPKIADAAAATNGNGAASGSTTDMLIRELLTEIRMSRGGTLAADSMNQATDLNARALSTGVEAVRATLVQPVAPAAPSRMESLMEKFMEAMILKSMNPPETNHFKDTLSLINEIKTAGFIGGSPKADWGTALVANLPMITDRVVTGLHEFRLQAESQERTMRLQRGEMRPGDPNVITMPGAATQDAPMPNGPTTPLAADTPQNVPPESVEMIIMQADLQRLVNAMKQPDCTGADIYDYLRNVWPAMLDELAQYNKGTLLMFFQSPVIQKQKLGNDILSQVGNDPRLPRMIEEFLKEAKENAAPPPAV